ncbi:MAG: hypothetical protein FWD76_01240 [Firmicutes bacterium]|nr:hypothetical protein [Bacillota bacterium]
MESVLAILLAVFGWLFGVVAVICAILGIVTTAMYHYKKSEGENNQYLQNTATRYWTIFLAISIAFAVVMMVTMVLAFVKA